MNIIHVIERADFPENLKRVDKEIDPSTHIYDSGFWYVAVATAERLVGGRIYLHETQTGPSRFGGTILGFQIAGEGKDKGKIIFRFQASSDAKGVRTSKDGWGMEKKIVLDHPLSGDVEADG